MINKPSRQGAKRLVCGSLVAATSVLGLGVAVASSADAASTALTAKPAQAAYHTSQTATINVTSTGSPKSLLFDILSGPDTPAVPTNVGMACNNDTTTNADGTFTTTCSFTNNGNNGTDTIRVYDDLDGTHTYSSGDTVAPNVTVEFGNDASSFGLSPSATSVFANNPEVYTITGKDAQGHPSVGQTVNVTVTETVQATSAPSTNPLSFTTSNPSAPSNTTSPAPVEASDGKSYTATITGQVKIGVDGTVKVGVVSTAPGSVNFAVANTAGTVSNSSTYNVTGGQSGDQAVRAISVTPTSGSGNVGASVTYKVTATDATSGGSPVGGAQVYYVVTSGPDAAAGSYTACGGTTSSTDGSTSCSVTNSSGKGPGTDSITFFVNHNPAVAGTGQTSVTPGPDSGEPQQTVSAVFTQAPLYDSLTITCVPPGATEPSTTCYQPSNTASTTFTVTVEHRNGQGVEQPVANAIVNLSVYQTNFSSPNGVLPSSVTTGTNGTVTFTVTPTTADTANGKYLYFRGIVGNGSTYDGGNGNGGYGYAYLEYEDRQISDIKLTPLAQTQQIGGSASVTATVTDQFGKAVSSQPVYFHVQGRNNLNSTGMYNTDTTGKVTYTYNDQANNITSGQDTVCASTSQGIFGGCNNGFNGLQDDQDATVNWVQSTTATQLTFAVTTCDNASTTSANTTTTATFPVSSYANNVNNDEFVCAVVQNAAGDDLAGQSVNVSTTLGYLDDGTTGDTPPTATSATGTTDGDGIFTIGVGSTKVGTATITAKVGTLTKTVTVTYKPGAPVKITVTPASTAIPAGGSAKFTATAVDQFGNPSSFYPLTFQQSGPGNFAGASSISPTTDSNGQASVTLSVPSGSTGGGTVTALYNPQGSNGSPVSGTATYTVGGTTMGQTQSVSVTGLTSVVVRNVETATATVTDTNGNAVANQSVSFATSGSQVTTGTAMTDSTGKATFSFRTTHAGSLTVKATSGSVSGAQSVTIEKQAVTVTLSAVSTTKGTVTLTAYASPVTGVVVGANMGYYQQTSSGYTGPARKVIGSNGGARIVLNRTSGSTYTFYATVVDSSDVSSTQSSTQTVKIK